MKQFSAERLKNLRKKKGYSLEQMARLLMLHSQKQITRSAISHWENGQNIPSIDSLLAISELFKTPIDFFFASRSNKLFDEAEPALAQLPEDLARPEERL